MNGIVSVKSNVDALGQPKAPHGNEDKDFPAKDSSLGGNLGRGKGNDWKDFSKTGTLYVNDINTSDIRQGTLGTCYLLSAIAAICEKKPGLLKQNLLDNGNGWYGLRWYCKGIPKDTWVDDKFPTKDGNLRFAHSEKNELWVAVMEKCYAKEYSKYSKIEGGFPGDAMHDITGKPSVCHSLQTHWDNDNWEFVSNCSKPGKIVCAGISSSPLRRMLFVVERHVVLILSCIYNAIDNLFEICNLDCVLNLIEFVFAYMWIAIWWLLGAIDNLCCGIFSMIHSMLCLVFVGLAPGHAYSILEIKTFPSCGCLETKLIKLRNPWGKGEWKGCYSDNSLIWSLQSDLKEKCKIVEKDDGAFWMSFSDFQKYFDTVDCLHYDDNYFETRIQGELKKKSASISFDVPTACKVRASFTQPRSDLDKRFICRIGIKGPGGAFLTRSEYSQGSCNHSTEEIDLSPGTYSVQIDGRRNKNLNFKFRLMISASAAGISFNISDGATNKPNEHPNANVVIPVNNIPPFSVDNDNDDKGGDNDDDNEDDDDDDDDDVEKGGSKNGDGKKKGKKKKGGKKK